MSGKIKLIRLLFFIAVCFAMGVGATSVNAQKVPTFAADLNSCSASTGQQQQCTQIFNLIGKIYEEDVTKVPIEVDCTGFNQKVCDFLKSKPDSYKVSGTAASGEKGVKGANCSSPSDCQAGLSCDKASGKCSNACTLDSDCGSSDQVCDVSSFGINNGACTAKTSPGQSGGATTPQRPSGPSTGGSGNCPEGLTSLGNGLCLPSQGAPTSGLAATKSLSELITGIIKILLWFAGSIAVAMLVVGGFWYMTAGGNEEQAEKGKKTIFNFVLGLAVIILAYTLVTILADLLSNSKYIGQ